MMVAGGGQPPTEAARRRRVVNMGKVSEPLPSSMSSFQPISGMGQPFYIGASMADSALAQRLENSFGSLERDENSHALHASLVRNSDAAGSILENGTSSAVAKDSGRTWVEGGERRDSPTAAGWVYYDMTTAREVSRREVKQSALAFLEEVKRQKANERDQPLSASGNGDRSVGDGVGGVVGGDCWSRKADASAGGAEVVPEERNSLIRETTKESVIEKYCHNHYRKKHIPQVSPSGSPSSWSSSQPLVDQKAPKAALATEERKRLAVRGKWARRACGDEDEDDSMIDVLGSGAGYAVGSDFGSGNLANLTAWSLRAICGDSADYSDERDALDEEMSTGIREVNVDSDGDSAGPPYGGGDSSLKELFRHMADDRQKLKQLSSQQSAVRRGGAWLARSSSGPLGTIAEEEMCEEDEGKKLDKN